MTILTNRYSALALLAVLLAGCGLKGPLYIPPPETEPEATAAPAGADQPADADTSESESEKENDG
jgi:predicted small lipoprotein YifL